MTFPQRLSWDDTFVSGALLCNDGRVGVYTNFWQRKDRFGCFRTLYWNPQRSAILLAAKDNERYLRREGEKSPDGTLTKP